MNSDLFIENKMVIDGEPDQPELPFDDLDDPCAICGIPTDAAGGVCESCITHSITLDNALAYGAERKESIEINGFLKWAYGDYIERMLLEAIKEDRIYLPTLTDKHVKDYCTDDVLDFSDWLKGDT